MKVVRVKIPSVRPMVRCSLKRLLRTMPSVVLLVFVVGLIFLTLMQIAVIHANRRALYAQRDTQPQQSNTAIIVASAGNPVVVNSNGNNGQTFRNTANVITASGNGATADPVGSGDNSKTATVVSSPNGQKEPNKKGPPDVVRVEAFVDRNAPSVEANMAALRSDINVGRIRQLVTLALAELKERRRTISERMNNNNSTMYYNNFQRDKSTAAIFKSNSIGSGAGGDLNVLLEGQASADGGLNPAIGGSLDLGLAGRRDAKDKDMANRKEQHVDTLKTLDDEYHGRISLRGMSHDDKLENVPVKQLCPPVPPHLVGRMKVNLNGHATWDGIKRDNPWLRPGGAWWPTSCRARHRVALIVPYRDREEHLATLLAHLYPILQRQQNHFKVYVVEQFGNDTFNKGVLMNAGVREALKEEDFHCFVFHDVDMIPEDDRNMYTCPENPRHLSVAVDKFNYSLPYAMLVGGVFAIKTEHFATVNGYSNLYWGWGGEDDDIAYRIKFRKLPIVRPPESVARYSMIKHDHRAESPNNVRSALLRMSKRRSARDGLNSVKYRLVSKIAFPVYTHLMIDIGQNHRWKFVQGKKLIISF